MGCVYLCGTGTIRTGTEFIYLSCTKLCPVKSTNMPQNFQRGTAFLAISFIAENNHERNWLFNVLF